MNATQYYEKVIGLNIDVQNDFCPGGSLAVNSGDRVIPPLNKVNRWVRDQNGLVIFTRDWHPTGSEHFNKWPAHCVQYKAGAAFHEDLELINPTEVYGYSPDKADLVVSKGIYSSEDAYSGFDARVQWPASAKFLKSGASYDRLKLLALTASFSLKGLPVGPKVTTRSLTIRVQVKGSPH